MSKKPKKPKHRVRVQRRVRKPITDKVFLDFAREIHTRDLATLSRMIADLEANYIHGRRRGKELLAAAYNNRGNLYKEQGQADEALADYNKALELKPDYAAAYNNRGALYGELGQADAALADLNKALELKPDYTEAYNNRGALYREQGQRAAALADLNKALELKPDYTEAYNNRGALYREQGQRAAALADLNKALELKPDYAVAYNNRGALYREQGQRAAALADYNKALELKPDYAAAYNNRGALYGELGQADAALADYNKALELKPDYAAAYNNRGVLYRELGQREAALADFNKVLELKPGYAEAYNNRGVLYRELGQREAALADYNKALELKPDYAEAYNNRGALYREQGQADAALADYNKALELKPDYAEPYNNRGILYKELGQEQLAQEDFARFRELVPIVVPQYEKIPPMEQISIHNFKSIEKLECLRLGAINILIGANGGGKSNLLQFFALMQARFGGELEPYIEQRGGIYSFIRGGQKDTAITLEAHFGDIIHQLSLVATASEKPRIKQEQWYIPALGWLDSNAISAQGGKLQQLDFASMIKEVYRNWQFFQFHDTSREARVRRKQLAHDTYSLRSDASNIAPYLYHLQEEKPEIYREICNTIRFALPQFADFHLVRDESGPEAKINLQWLQKGSSVPLLPHNLSDGSLRFICLATALQQDCSPACIIIDEPELGLHPEALHILAELIYSASHDSQLIIATQSPLLLDYFEPEHIITCHYENGQSRFERPDPEQLKHWLDEYTLGELWRKNVLDAGTNYV